MKKRRRFIPADENEISALQSALNIHPLLCRLLAQRGITSFEQAKQFFRPSLTQLHDPFLMKDMDKAVDRIEKAIRREEKILLYGDYDVDGTTSVALMFTFLKNYTKELDYYIPNRDKEGYGISQEGILYAKESEASLILAMDCGIRAVKKVELAKLYGIDFIICDHHRPGEKIPTAIAVLDPLQSDCQYPEQVLSGCGVAFKLAQAFQQKIAMDWPQLENLLDFLVLSIAADIVPITGENRILAHFGLKYLNETSKPGLRALIKAGKNQSPLSIRDIVYGVAPMINATGRLADAQQAVRLLLSTEKTVAKDAAKVLVYRNSLRKEYDKNTTKEALELWNETPGKENRKSIVLYQAHWQKGIAGITAARMVDNFNLPATILTKSNDKLVGSARSIKGFNLYEALKKCEDLLVNFGGHTHAAGLTILPENLEVFQDRFEAVSASTISEDALIPEIEIAGELSLEDITPKFWRILKQFAPFGPGNRNPVFLAKNVSDSGASRILRGNHLQLSIKQGKSGIFKGIAFGMGDMFSTIQKVPFSICFSLQENRWRGKSTLQLNIKDINVE